MDWFRSYHGAPSDTKLSLIALASGQPRAFVTAVWWEVLDHASRTVTQCHARGDVSQIDAEIIAFQQGMTAEQVAAILEAMRARGVIAEGRVANWEKRQPKREDAQATERKRNQRERDAQRAAECHAVSRGVTTEERREEEKREQRGKQPPPPKKVTLESLSVDHIASWLAGKRAEGLYLRHDEREVLASFKDYCLANGKDYKNYPAALRNAFGWERFAPKPAEQAAHPRRAGAVSL